MRKQNKPSRKRSPSWIGTRPINRKARRQTWAWNKNGPWKESMLSIFVIAPLLRQKDGSYKRADAE